jgi:hypothetical protein
MLKFIKWNRENSEEFISGIDGYQTNVTNPDSDYDNLSDYWEFMNATDPWNPDIDGDNLADGDEFTFNTDVRDIDSDSDNVLDGDEVHLYGTNPIEPETDGDGLNDGAELFQHNTSALDTDTDDDQLIDSWEVANGTNPLIYDSLYDFDGDMLNNFLEFQYGTDPNNPDCDGDSVSDGQEIASGTNPLDPNSVPSGPTTADNTLIWISILIAGIAIALSIVLHGFLARSRPRKELPPPKTPKGGMQ